MDIKIIDNFFSKTGLRDFENILDEPKWKIVKNISAPLNKGVGLTRHIGQEEDHLYLSLYPVHVISKFLNKDYSCVRMRLRATWPSDDEGTEPHIDAAVSDYDITAVIYLHDSDGDLIIYDSIDSDPLTKDVKRKMITPKANTCVLMLKKYYHHAMRPSKSLIRYSININMKEVV